MLDSNTLTSYKMQLFDWITRNNTPVNWRSTREIILKTIGSFVWIDWMVGYISIAFVSIDDSPTQIRGGIDNSRCVFHSGNPQIVDDPIGLGR